MDGAHLEESAVDERIILKQILKKKVRIQPGLLWLRIGPGEELL
jgi:hypothetical protein